VYRPTQKSVTASWEGPDTRDALGEVIRVGVDSNPGTLGCPAPWGGPYSALPLGGNEDIRN
jgi:hypothetical protein